MLGPVTLIRSGQIGELRTRGTLFSWNEGKAHLFADEVRYRDVPGLILCYFNPPVHQVGNPGLDAYLACLNKILERSDAFRFLILYGANDAVHAGGDLKESLTNLDRTLELRKAREASGAGPEEVDSLYAWADKRIAKGIALHGLLRRISAQGIRSVAVCGGGTRYGGSAEIPLMADVLVGDSRSGMCFSEAMIGLIPGWAGIARALVKAGPLNASSMARTCREIKAADLKAIGIYNETVHVPFGFPRRDNTGNPEADRNRYEQDLQEHNDKTGRLLLPRALDLAMCPEEALPMVGAEARASLGTEADIAGEVARRSAPDTYKGLWGRPLKDAKEPLTRLGRPLAPQSIAALDRLLEGYDPARFDEAHFVRQEMEADARLYRDPRFRAGLVATLEQRVADFRMPGQ